MSKYHRKDTVHNPICNALATAGCAVLDLSGLGDGVPDALVIRGPVGRETAILMEFKSKYGKFTPKQIEWRNKNPRLLQYTVSIHNENQAFQTMGIEIINESNG